MTHDLQRERTLVLIKPDAVKRGLIGEVISRIERVGLKIVGMQMTKPTVEHFNKHYPGSDDFLRIIGGKTLETYKKFEMDPAKEMGTDDPLAIGRPVRGWLMDFMTSGPIVKMAVEGLHAVSTVRKIVGSTMPEQAAPGTIRGDFSADSSSLANAKKRSVKNLIHASGTLEEAVQEVNLWFLSNELFPFERADEEILF